MGRQNQHGRFLSRLGIGRIGSLPWYTPIIASLLALVLVLLTVLLGKPPRSESSEWVEVSRGTLLRAVRHRPTGRCFVRYSEGGLVETGAEVCIASR